MIQLNVNPVDSVTGQSVPNPIITLGIMNNKGQAVPMEPAIRVQSNFWNGPNYGQQNPYIVYGTVRAPGYKETYFGPVTWDGQSTLNIPVVMSLGFKRPAPVKQSPLPAFDASNPDGSGIVHTTPPPELIIPPHFTDPLFLRADFNGITLNLSRWGIPTPAPGRTLYDIVGANSTPAAMIMSPMLPLYPRKLQDAWLTESAERAYDDVVIASEGWDFATNGFSFTIPTFVAWAKYVKSWGNRIVYWGNCEPDDPYMLALLDAGLLNFSIVGEEVNSKVDPPTLEAIIQNHLGHLGTIPCGVHFTDNWPLRAPLDTYLTNWAPYDGRLHLCWQANQKETAGTQGGSLYYARMRVNLGWQGDADFEPQFAAPNSRVILFEMQASDQLDGLCTEEYGCLRSLESLYCTRLDPHILPLSGACNGLRYPDGTGV